jgi:nucleoside 2-deoxyribosyltransferase
MEEWEKCPICGNKLSNKIPDVNVMSTINSCKTCGDYKISQEADDALRSSKYDKDKYILSCVLREATKNGKKIVLDTKNIQDYIDSASIPDGPLEAIDRIIFYVYRKSETADSYISLKPEEHPISCAKNVDEFRFYIKKATEIGYLERDTKDGSIDYRLTLKGWERVDELRKKTPESRQAFVAMWFSDVVKDAWTEAIKPALKETGYKPVRIDLVQHNDKIDDRIIAEIRKSGLLIADFTGNRGGVYFEAGLAMGLGIPVIWTCQKYALKEVHFDTRQYNHIVWETPEELKEKLKKRIEETMQILTK